MKISEITTDQALQRGLARGEVGWAVHDVKPGYLNGMDRFGWRYLNNLIKNQQWKIVDLPLKVLTASQEKVHPDFRDAAQRYDGTDDPQSYPFVVKQGGRLVIQDGHHRVANAAASGSQTIRCRYIDMDAIEQDERQLQLPDAH